MKTAISFRGYLGWSKKYGRKNVKSATFNVVWMCINVSNADLDCINSRRPLVSIHRCLRLYISIFPGIIYIAFVVNYNWSVCAFVCFECRLFLFFVHIHFDFSRNMPQFECRLAISHWCLIELMFNVWK